MTKEEAKEFIEERKKLEIKIHQLECIKISDMTVAQVYGKLDHLRTLYNQHRQLSEKIKMMERLVPQLN